MKDSPNKIIKIIFIIVLVAVSVFAIVRVTDAKVKKITETKHRINISKEEIKERCDQYGTTVEFFPGDYNKTKIVKNLTTYKGVDYSLVYNPQYYYNNYEPAKEACGTDAVKLINHFMKEGMVLGVRACEGFDVASYYNANKDLREQFGPDFRQYYKHYVSTGHNEPNRKVLDVPEILEPITVYDGFDYAKAYDLKYYIENNEDLREYVTIPGPAGCINDAKAIQHFIESGIEELRQASENFDFVSYFVSNPDLRELYRTNFLAYVVHYVNNEPDEGRVAVGRHNYDEYKQALFDLKPTIEKETIKRLNIIGYNLYAAYAWCVRIPYVNLPLNWSAESYAMYAFGNGRGNCFSKACALYYMARYLGYDAHVVRGYCLSAAGERLSAHGWVEINGLLYDPDFEMEKGRNGFGISYGDEGTFRYADYWYMT